VPSWLSYVIGAVIAVLIALLLAPIIPEPGGQIIAILSWIVAAILAILALVSLLRGSRV
jgi:predicted ABC-type exoprotein transport system permease subunit